MSAERSIGVLSGGDSPERGISLVSGRHVHCALRGLGYESRPISIDSLDDLVRSLEDIDVVFNCLHGGSGEDGTVQLLLDIMDIPYAGSGAQACARSMDKVLARKLLTAQRITVPPGVSHAEEHLDGLVEQVERALSYPLVVKPTNAGSTIAVSVVRDRDSLRDAASAVGQEFGSVLVEEYIQGRELTVGILRIDEADTPLPVVEIRPPDGLFDYRAKYTEGVAEFLAPAPLDPETSSLVQATALRAHQTLGCFGFSRVDLRLSEAAVPYVLEVNTLPGMTPMSDLPRAAAANGIPYAELVERMLRTAEKEGR